MPNIYDEAIEKLKEFGEIEVHEDDGVIEEYWLIGETEPIKNAIKTLERAKKVEELLDLKSQKVKLLSEKCGCISAVALKIDYQKNKNRWNEIDKYMHRLNDKIDKLEKELEEMK